MRLIDIGVNLMNRSFDRDREQLVLEARKAGVSPLIITGSSEASSRAAADYAKRFPGELYATAGVHPHEAKHCNSETLETLTGLAGRKEVIAIGECGLDYNRDFSPRPVQRMWFIKQIELAEKFSMPLFLHERDAFDDLYSILREHRNSVSRMVIHCFTGTEEALDKYLELGAFIGITGWICDERRGSRLKSLVKKIPPDRLMTETDAPYLIPRDLPRGESGRQSGRNEPKFLPHIAQTIAAALEKETECFAKESFANALRFFGITRSPISL
ncbi:MAG: TatD family hydrolase [Spirochaetaceae bacterium]|jgi:TatD DNase family protein|nr:TatD family hydrolase [Spirochaetaceae bacterium]